MWIVRKIITHIFDFIFPTYCYLCKQETLPLCISCVKSLPRSIESPFPYITSIYSFQDKRIKRIIHAIKYFHKKELIKPIIEEIIVDILKQNYKNAIIVPIPMPVLRKYIRGYNHTEAIAKEVSKKTQITIEKNILILAKKSSRKRQVKTRSRSERLQNKNGAFLVQKDVSGKICILIDDVTTTGATLSEARRVLIKNNAHTVVAYTIAH